MNSVLGLTARRGGDWFESRRRFDLTASVRRRRLRRAVEAMLAGSESVWCTVILMCVCVCVKRIEIYVLNLALKKKMTMMILH